METPFILQQEGLYTIVEFRTASLMDAMALDELGKMLYPLVDEQDKRLLILDFSNVQFISSQAIGILLTLNKKLSALKGGKLILCGVQPRLMELIKITRLDRVLTIKPTRHEAVKVPAK
jgi:anti-sigma B factor antagonist